MILLALDVGDARIGVAKGESGTSFAFGRGFISRQELEEDITAVKELMAQEDATRLVIGLPRHRDGSDSPQTTKVRAFAGALETEGLEVVFEDERFTTRLATQSILQSGASKKKRRDKGRVDEASAVLILESYLAKHPV